MLIDNSRLLIGNSGLLNSGLLIGNSGLPIDNSGLLTSLNKFEHSHDMRATIHMLQFRIAD